MHSHHVPAHVDKVRKQFREAYTKAHLQTNNEVEQQKCYYDRATSTVQLMPGDIVLMKLDVFQGKRKVKDRWSKVEYVVVRQVANDVPTYEVKDDGRNIKVIHHNMLFLVAPTREAATNLGGGESISYVSTAWSALAELTPLECGKNIRKQSGEHAYPVPPQSCSAQMGEWCSMATTFGGPKTDCKWVRIW